MGAGGKEHEESGAERVTVLVVEDDAGIAALLRRRLERMGHTTIAASTVEAARQEVQQGKVDLLVLDYRLNGGASGLDFYRDLLAEGFDLPAILVTGFANEPMLAEAIRVGIRDFLPKTPDFLDALPLAVERVMKQVRAERVLAESEALRASNRRLQTLSEISSELFFQEEPQAFIANLCRRLASQLDLSVCFHHLLEEDGQTLRLAGYHGVSEQTARQFGRSPLGEAASGAAVLERRPIILEDVQHSTDPRAAGVRSLGVTSFVCYPLLHGQLLGTVAFGTQKQPTFHPEDLKLLRTVCDQVATAIERKRLHDRLESERGRLEAVLRQMPAGVLTAEAPSGKLTLSNEQVEQIWRHPFLPCDTIEDYHQYRGFHPDGRPYRPDEWPLARSITTGEVVTQEEIEIQRGDGTRGTVSFSSSPVVNSDGRIMAGVVTLHDITERKRTEEALRARERQQAAINELGLMALVGADLANLMDRAVDLVAETLDVEHAKVLELLPDGQALLLRAGVGWQAGCVGRAMVGAGLDSQAGYTLTLPADEIVMVDDLRSETRFSGPLLLHEHGVVSGMSTIIWSRERPYGVLGAHARQRRTFTQDNAQFLRSMANILAMAIERKRLEEELRQRAEALALADRRKDEFLAMLGHELRNPLSPIYNALNLIRRRGADDPRAERSLELIERQIRHINRLIDDLLNIARITEGKLDLQRQRIDLASLVRDVAGDSRCLLEEAGLTLSMELPDAPVWVEADPVRLSQVIGNLLTNASKFTDPAGRVTVRCGVSGPGDGGADLAPGTEGSALAAFVSVRDTGIGIDPELLPHLFERFIQADCSLNRSRGGLGLGLTLVKGLVELHGGEVRAHSEGRGRGSEFTLRLPMTSSPQTSDTGSPPGDRTPRPDRILIVEDNRAAADTLCELLEEMGSTVEVTYSGTEAVEAARQFRPAVVLCDLGLPGVNGYEVAEALRQHPATAGVRLIAMSGFGQEEDQRRARQAGFDLHLTKPVDFVDLCRLLGLDPNQAQM